MNRFTPRNVLGICAIVIAGVASMADEPVRHEWDVTDTIQGDPLTLDAANPRATRSVTMTANADANAQGSIDGTMTAAASACGAGASDARLRILVQDSAGNGQVIEKSLPACPETKPLNVAAYFSSYTNNCDSGAECSQKYIITFQKTGSTDGQVQVTWEADAIVGSYASKPAGAAVTITIDP